MLVSSNQTHAIAGIVPSGGKEQGFSGFSNHHLDIAKVGIGMAESEHLQTRQSEILPQQPPEGIGSQLWFALLCWEEKMGELGLLCFIHIGWSKKGRYPSIHQPILFWFLQIKRLVRIHPHPKSMLQVRMFTACKQIGL